MSYDSSSRDTSPDPIVLPSSPLGHHRSARKSTPRRNTLSSRKFSRNSPSKSLLLDTPGGNGGESPWRIRVTVEAEPREGSPGKKRRSTSPSKKTAVGKTVPLKAESPTKGGEKNTRKRKGTPIRRGRSTRHQPPPAPAAPVPEIVAPTTEESQYEDEDGDIVLQDIEMPPPPRPGGSANRRTSGRIGRLNSQSAPTLRSQRLSLAREELDIALQDAVGYGEGEEGYTTRLLGEVDFSKSTRDFGRSTRDFSKSVSGRMLGDATLSRNEDFSMISVETLQTAKDSSRLGDSMGSRSGLGNSTGSNGAGYVGGSSPPKRDSLRRSVLGQPVEFGRSSALGKAMEFGKSTTSALSRSVESSSGRRSALGSPAEITASSSRRNEDDAMSWKATGPIKELTPSSQLKPGSSHIRRSTGSQPTDAPRSYGMDGAEDEEEDISQGIDLDDIWQDEASRSVHSQHPAVEQPEDEEEDNDELQAEEDQLQSDAAAQSASHTPALEDLFADQPLRPARGKIPKTWRRSSGMVFSYVDSPGHGLVEDKGEEVGERRDSVEGSGVLTPPSTSEEEGDVVDEDMEYQEEGREESEYELNQEDVGEEDVQNEEMQSEWNQPDAEATRYEGQNHFQEEHDVEEVGKDMEDRTTARNHHVSPLSDDNDDDDDTGDFFQQNMPHVYSAQRNRPRKPPPRPTRDEGTVDLTDLLGLRSSPMKPAAPTPIQSNTPAASSTSNTRPAQRSAQLHGQAFDGKMKLNPPHQQGGSGGKAKVVDSPLRKSLLKSSKMHGGSPDSKRQGRNSPQQQPPPRPQIRNFAGIAAPARRPQQVHRQPQAAILRPESKEKSGDVLSPAILDRSQTRFPNSHSRVEVELDSFASKASDQRQLLGEMTPRIGTGQPTGQSYEQSSEGPSSPAPAIRSYEENLNVDSPQKIPVHFGDSSSMLPPTKLFLSQAGRKSISGNPAGQPHPLFAQRQPLAPKPIALVDKRASHEVGKTVGGLFSRLSETFWSAVGGPTGPTEIMPAPPAPQQQQKIRHQPREQRESTISATWETEEETDEGMGMFNTSLRTAIRNRYGVLPSSFPWTMAHMRTLHRMLNSLISERPDSLIPNAGPLPEFLEAIVETEQETPVGKTFVFTKEYAYVIFSFLQILVEGEVVRAMERGEVQALGDELSRSFRGVVEGDVRRGGDRVFRDKGTGRWREEGEIGWDYVVGALGCAVRSNEVAEVQQRGRGNVCDEECMIGTIGNDFFVGSLGSGYH